MAVPFIVGQPYYDANWAALAALSPPPPSSPSGAILVSEAGGPAWIQAAPEFGGIVAIAPSNGVTDATSALSALAALATPLFIPHGTYLISGNLTFTAPVTMAEGASILSTTSTTVAFNDGFYAPLTQVFTFSGGAKATFAETLVGYPEWWGAVTGSPTFDCAPAINACVIACLDTQLQAGAYYVQTQINILLPGRRLRGIAASQQPTKADGSPSISANATQIIMTNTVANAVTRGILCGSTSLTQPARFVEFIRLEDFDLVRATASVPLGVSGALAIQNPASGAIPATTPCPEGIRFQWCANSYINRVLTAEHSVGYYFFGCVENYFYNASALRYTVGANTGNDNWSGFYMDNSAPLSANSGNASMYFIFCRAFSNVGSVSYTYNAALTSYQGFTDTVIFGFESGLVQYGLELNGRVYSGFDFQTEDLVIANCLLDSSLVACISIKTGGYNTAMTIANSYLAIQSTGTPSAILLSNLYGSTAVTGCQMINQATSTSVTATSVNGLSLVNNIHTGFAAPIVLSSCTNFRITDHINASGAGVNNPAVSLTGCTRGYIQTIIDRGGPGSTGSYNSGVNLISTGNSKIEINVTSIDPACISVANAAVVANATNITSTGPFTYGTISGVF